MLAQVRYVSSRGGARFVDYPQTDYGEPGIVVEEAQNRTRGHCRARVATVGDAEIITWFDNDVSQSEIRRTSVYTSTISTDTD